ncbi:MAG: hypothetical protein Edafosvirus56_2 [Edafosvirus sp.]|uniref:Uncharacterized protein n=1 Tax=Edafosvirus sp. TaxID=2487765 RepID=A0A3G4ZVN2_9VIRU|nr:MAG: hypothetical protein Edafosvirus56_2 [Edafosvirus sp.]
MQGFGSENGHVEEDGCKHICGPVITEEDWRDHKIPIIVIICVLTAMIVGFGISDATIYGQSRDFTSTGDTCPSFPQNLTSYTLKKQLLKQWKWTYNFQEFSGYVNQRCPSVLHDSDIYLGDSLISRSDQKVTSLVGRTYIYDCHGTIIYQVQAHDLFDAIINGLKITVSFQIMSADGSNTVGYVKGRYLIYDHIVIIDSYGNDIAHIDRDLLGLTWTFAVSNTSSPVSDPRVLTKLAAYKSFSEGDNTDGCNNYFWGIAWFFLAIGILLFLWLCRIVWYPCGLGKKCCPTNT